MTGQPVTDRTLPAPWGVCDWCGEAAGLPQPGRRGDVYCAKHAALAALTDAAERSLEDLAAPIVGAWAAQWTAAGVPFRDLVSLADILTGAVYREEYRVQHVRTHLRRLRTEHRPPAFAPHRPDRFELPTAPTLAHSLPDGTAGNRWPQFITTAGDSVTLPVGRDALTLPDGEGGALLIFVGARGRTGEPEAYRVPAALLPDVRAALSGEERAA